MLLIGLRVVRGPDWKWGGQDKGEGHCGTVVELGKQGSKASPDKTVVVQWDSGLRTNYRVGYDGLFDLRVSDNAPAGVLHPNLICDGCKRHGIAGMRFKCTRCYDYDLCSQCYMIDKHDLNHVFQRFDTVHNIGIELQPRKGSPKVQLQGIFIGAKVVRGPDWDWNDQDGGEGKTGRVLDIRGWDNESERSVANVIWSSGSKNVYRLGHKGKVDLKCIEPTSAGTYYREHLPILGHCLDVSVDVQLNSFNDVPRHLTFSVGDKVKVVMDIEALKAIQEGHGGWNQKMADFIGQTGIVHRVTERGDIRVTYDGCNNRWTFHPAALTKIVTFIIGDTVRMVQDVDLVKEFQKGHGEWIEVMRGALGKVGKVIKIYPDGDLRVSIEMHTWTLNPLCVEVVPGSSTELHNNTMGAELRPDSTGPLMCEMMLKGELEATALDKLVREAAQGHVDVVREFLRKFPDKVDITSNGKSCLQVACHQGHMDVICFLLASGASLQLHDDDGDTALHYAAFGNQPEIMELLLKQGANINLTNKGQCTALHVAVNKRHLHCVRILIKYHCDVNIQDSYGDTALHDAIGKDSTDTIDTLISVNGVDYTLKNKRGFNLLHHAALKGNSFAMDKLVSRARQLVDVKKDDGFAALHLACLNGHRAVIETLLNQGQAELDLRNNRKQTPLMLAVSQGHCSVIELIVSMGSDLSAEDEDGDTSLHMSLMKMATIIPVMHELEAPSIHGIWMQLAGHRLEHAGALAIACYLAQEGCALNKPNNKGKTPLDLVSDTPIIDILTEYSTQEPVVEKEGVVVASGSGESSQTDEGGGEPSSRALAVECSVCSELADSNVLLEPCGHRIACEECTSRMKKCLKCGVDITKRLTQDGRVVASKSRQPSAERLRYLESKIAEIEEAHCCSICMERRRNVAFLCGHGACDKCSHSLRLCHMCRKVITKKINLY